MNVIVGGITQHNRSSDRTSSVKMVFSKVFRKIHRKTLVLESLLNNVAGLRPAKFLRTPSLQNTFRRLLLTQESLKLLKERTTVPAV